MTSTSPRRRGDKRDRTKAALIEAFWNIVDDQGFAAATLEAVASRAGMSRGAIYSNFASRADLLFAAASVRGLKIDRDFTVPAPLAEQLKRFADSLIETLPDAPATQLWHAELLLHIASQPKLKAQAAAGFATMLRTMGSQLQTHHADDLAIGPAALALAIQALTMGLVYQAILNPETVTEDAVRQAFAALAKGALK